jgi:hypothetical protein
MCVYQEVYLNQFIIIQGISRFLLQGSKRQFFAT